MLQAQRQLLRASSSATTAFLFPSPVPFPLNRNLPRRRKSVDSVCCANLTATATTVVASISVSPPDEGHYELISWVPSFIAAAGDSTALQTASSFLLTGSFALFLFRLLRRRAKRVKAMRIRSSSAMENLKMVSKSPIKTKKPPSPDQALLGALIAAVFGVLLYKFTTTVEYTLNRQALSDNFSVRQITITIRTIINGLCYLATFVFGFNSLGLFLYSGQLAMNSFVEVHSSDNEAQLNSSNPNLRDVNGPGATSAGEDDDRQDKTL